MISANYVASIKTRDPRDFFFKRGAKKFGGSDGWANAWQRGCISWKDKKPEQAAAWKKRTLTNLYNEQPAGLRFRQEQLDRTVALAYGWTDWTPETAGETILTRLLASNLERREGEGL